MISDSAKMPIEKLGIRPITVTEKEMLAERGQLFREFTKESTPATYTGNLIIPSWPRDRIQAPMVV